MERQKLTAEQEKIFRFLAAHFAKHQRIPTLRSERAHGVRQHPAGANSHLVALERKGYIRLNRAKGTKGAARGFEIVELAEAIAPVVEKHVDEMLKESKS
jgi:SOS-response transcriptional repressor LexA